MKNFRALDEAFADTSVQLCIDAYNKLPKTGKPTKDEWTVLSAVVEEDSTKLRVVSLGTGSKCIGKSFLCPSGRVVNDSHAEVIARRGFLLYLYSEIMTLHKTGTSTVFSEFQNGKLKLKSSLRFGFVSSVVPCGDAAIIPVLESLLPATHLSLDNPSEEPSEEESRPPKRLRLIELEASDIHRTGAKCLPTEEKQDLKLPGSDYHTVGAVRTKPGRGDPTASVSCSDKIARWNIVGVQGALLSLLLEEPILYQFIVIAGGSQFSHKSMERALNERVGVPKKMVILHSRLPCPCDRSPERHRPAPASIAWNCSTNKATVFVEGRCLGATKRNLQRSVPNISKLMLLKQFFAVIETCESLSAFSNASNFRTMTYRQLKNLAENYQCCWKSTKENYFRVWTEKPSGMEDFIVN